MNLSVLIHTFNGYSHLWPGFAESFKKHWSDDQPFIPIYFGTDVKPEKQNVLHAGGTILSGVGEWSDRLTNLLQQVKTDYVLYMQEDHYLKDSPKIQKAFRIMGEHNLYRLQLSPVNQFYSLHGSGLPLYFHHTSKYLVSHQPSIWKKSFLLECLKPGETPWQNEYSGTIRLNARADIQNKIAIYPCDWYKHMCIKGKVVEG